MKEQPRNTQFQINEEDLGKQPKKEFRVMIVNMIQTSKTEWRKQKNQLKQATKTQKKIKNKQMTKILKLKIIFVSSVTQSCLTLCDPMDCSMPGFPVHQQILRLAQTHVQESVMPLNNFILFCTFLFLPSTFPSIKGFSNASVDHIRWLKIQLQHQSFQ